MKPDQQAKLLHRQGLYVQRATLNGLPVRLLLQVRPRPVQSVASGGNKCGLAKVKTKAPAYWVPTRK